MVKFKVGSNALSNNIKLASPSSLRPQAAETLAFFGDDAGTMKFCVPELPPSNLRFATSLKREAFGFGLNSGFFSKN